MRLFQTGINRHLVSRFVNTIILGIFPMIFPLIIQAGIPELERNALIDLYTSTDGAHWNTQDGWLGEAGTECNWFGVTCDGDSVVELSLSENALRGSIPLTISNFTNLERLHLNSNQLSGSIPSEIGTLEKLKELILTSNQLAGNIPSAIGNLHELQTLELAYNELNGSIPPELGKLKYLIYLYLRNNNLSGSIPPELGDESSLLTLHLAHNGLSGDIPANLSKLSNLRGLVLQHNQLGGIIPPELGHLANLRVLRLDTNQLTGTIPPTFGNLSNLLDLGLQFNQLSGSIPPELGNLRYLETLNLGYNQLTGNIPTTFGSLINLWWLELQNNHLSGNIPAELGNTWRNMFRLQLQSNCLRGDIPSQFSWFTHLGNLNLSYNALYATNSDVYNLLWSKQSGWISKQTVAPKSFAATIQPDSTIRFTWFPIAFQEQNGRYEIFASTNQGGPYTRVGSTSSNVSNSFVLPDLKPATTYYFVIRSVTDAHFYNPNIVISDYSAEISIATPAATSTIAVGTNPPGQRFTVDGITYTTTQVFSWIVGSSHNIGTDAAQTSTGTRFAFAGWTDGGASSHLVTTPLSSTVYTANFTIQYLLTTAAVPAVGGTVTASPASADGFYESGTSVQLSTAADRGFLFSGWSGDLTGTNNPQFLTISMPRSVTATFVHSSPATNLTLNSGGAASIQTPGTGSLRTGYADLTINSGTTPYGTAIFSLKQNGDIVSEAAVPASTPTTSARIFIDYRIRVNAIPARTEAGLVDINTGIALENYGSEAANVTYTMRDESGGTIAIGHGTVKAKNHKACFIDQLKDCLAPDFNLPADFAENVQFGSLDISSDQPISVLAMRETVNQNNHFLITTTPTADLTQALRNDPIYFPQFVDGEGYTTSIILLNTSDQTETGTLEIMDGDGNALAVTQIGGNTGSTLPYSIAPGGFYHFQSSGLPTSLKRGWVRLTPDFGKFAPVGSGVFAFNPGNLLISESGIPSVHPTTHARIYADLSGQYNTGLAIANTSGSGSSINVHAFEMDGVTPIGTSNGPVQLPLNGYRPAFADELVRGLPEGFTGVLDIASSTPFAALTVRMLIESSDRLIMTTFPVADLNQAAPSPVVFPRIADGDGYTTQFILINPSGAANATLRLYDANGTLMGLER